ncbi:glycosyl transferase family 2 [endosymbiont of unidentified scaly snail isolate Monju]|nr:glycosyl transferase family 2 [endosymbiont of unidentified scaly snail isolate Monju]
MIAVMVAWNGRPFLETAIPSVLEALGEHGELLVVENGSTDGSFDFLRARFPDVAVLQTGENLGGAGGFSAGMRVALEDPECHHVWLLDNDILVEPGALEPLLDALSSAPDIAAAGSQLCLYDRPDTVQELGSRYTPWLGALEQQHAGRSRLPADASPREVDYLAACSLLIRSDILRQHGLFHEALFVFYDDVEWSLRVRRAGHRLLAVPASVVRHCYGGDRPTVPWREYYRKRNRCICLRLEPPRRGRLLALYFYLVYVSALAHYLARQGDPVLAGIYRQALDDFDNGRLGRRDIVRPATAPLPCPKRPAEPGRILRCRRAMPRPPGRHCSKPQLNASRASIDLAPTSPTVRRLPWSANATVGQQPTVTNCSDIAAADVGPTSPTPVANGCSLGCAWQRP